MKKPLLWIMLLGIVMSPVYLNRSGLPQVADFIFVVFTGLYLMSLMRPGSSGFAGVLPIQWLLLVIWVNLVQIAWSMVSQSYDVLIHGLYYIYNYLVVFSIIAFLHRNMQYLKYFERSVAVALIVSFCGVLVEVGGGGRSTGFFNNPNQLAYFSLCALSIVQIMNKGLFSLRAINVAALLAGVLSILSASSLGAMAGLFILVIAHFMASNRIVLFLRMGIAGSVLLSCLFFLNIPMVDMAVQNVEKRFLKADEKVSSLSEERNYDRILKYPEYNLLGAGEGNFSRYGAGALEIHSSFGTLLFCYGFVGLSLFIALVLKSIRHAPIPVVVVILAPLVYSLTHMGLRSTFFWVMIGLLWLLYGKNRNHSAAMFRTQARRFVQ